MDMTGEQRISAPRAVVWRALNDPEILYQCITGCRSLSKTDETHFEALVEVKVGPMKAIFGSAVTLSDVQAPDRYTITGEGQGGAAGFAKGSTDLHLREEGDETVLTYAVRVSVGGRLAQLGGRLLDATARKMAADFFTRFAACLNPEQAAATASPPHPATAAGKSPDADTYIPMLGLHPLLWTGGLVALVIALIVAFSHV